MDPELKFWYLKRFELFQRLPESEIKEIDRRSLMKSYEPKSYIYFSLEDPDKVYLIKDGHVEVGYIDQEGKEFILDVLGPGDFFGAFTTAVELEGFARAVTQTFVCVLNTVDFADILIKNPDIAMEVLKRQSALVRSLQSKIKELVFHDVQYRVRSLLYGLFKKFADPKTSKFQIPLTHQDIASMVGCARETASAVLSDLKKSGIIDYSKKYITVISPERLKPVEF